MITLQPLPKVYFYDGMGTSIAPISISSYYYNYYC